MTLIQVYPINACGSQEASNQHLTMFEKIFGSQVAGSQVVYYFSAFENIWESDSQ